MSGSLRPGLLKAKLGYEDCLVFETDGLMRVQNDAEVMFARISDAVYMSGIWKVVLIGGTSSSVYDWFAEDEDTLDRLCNESQIQYVRLDPSGEGVKLIKNELGFDVSLEFRTFDQAKHQAELMGILYQRARQIAEARGFIEEENQALLEYPLVCRVEAAVWSPPKYEHQGQISEKFFRLFNLNRPLTSEQKLVALFRPDVEAQEVSGVLLTRRGPQSICLVNPGLYKTRFPDFLKKGYQALLPYASVTKNILVVNFVDCSQVFSLRFIPGDWVLKKHRDLKIVNTGADYQPAFHRVVSSFLKKV